MNTSPHKQPDPVKSGSTEPLTFMGLPNVSDLSMVDAKVAIIGAPFATPYPGTWAYCAGGPTAIREGTVTLEAARLMNFDFNLGAPIFQDGKVSAVDCGDLGYDEKDFAKNRIAIRTAIQTLLDKGTVPIVIGGDDSTPIPVMEAFHDKGKLTIIQIDAHIDWLEEFHGERWSGCSPMRRASEMSHVERIIQIGQRGLGSARLSDVEDARRWGVNFIPAQEVFAKGIQPILDLVPKGSNVLFTFDCDGLDPSIMPAVISPAPGGLTFWQALDIVHGVAAKARIAAFNLVEFMPERDIEKRGALLAGRIILNVMGLAIRQAAKR
ncbi:MAG: arginase [Mesorhizobium sp.]|uniref:agmatinase n=1 Tax=Mesorhizobium sp. TaxID=1871066 RepID=UPI000FE9051D|nr:agmatinase [Mesorhizobium sp.]RWE20243.1 MAG: arginase [Mesorhizobium sp.]